MREIQLFTGPSDAHNDIAAEVAIVFDETSDSAGELRAMLIAYDSTQDARNRLALWPSKDRNTEIPDSVLAPFTDEVLASFKVG